MIDHNDALCRLLIETSNAGNVKNSDKFREALGLLHKASDSHIPQAEHLLAVMYEYGLGVDENFHKAAEYYRRAAEKNYLESIYHLALMYTYGRGMPRDYYRALSLLEKSSQGDHPLSAYYMVMAFPITFFFHLLSSFLIGNIQIIWIWV
jgi:TPR repeat protein